MLNATRRWNSVKPEVRAEPVAKPPARRDAVGGIGLFAATHLLNDTGWQCALADHQQSCREKTIRYTSDAHSRPGMRLDPADFLTIHTVKHPHLSAYRFIADLIA